MRLAHSITSCQKRPFSLLAIPTVLCENPPNGLTFREKSGLQRLLGRLKSLVDVAGKVLTGHPVGVGKMVSNKMIVKKRKEKKCAGGWFQIAFMATLGTLCLTVMAVLNN